MLGEIVTINGGDGCQYLVKRDGLRDDGTRILRLRPLDGGPLQFVEPSDVTLAQPVITGRTTESEAHDEAEGQAEGDA